VGRGLRGTSRSRVKEYAKGIVIISGRKGSMVTRFDTDDRTPTRRKILVRLCGGGKTARELARDLGISATAVRTHLESLAAEGLVKHEVERRGVGKPTHVHEITPEAMTSLSKAYVPVLAAVLQGVAAGGVGLDDLLTRVGRSLANGHPPPHGTPEQRAEMAAGALESLGGVVDVVPAELGIALQGRCCTIGAVSARFPALCTMVETMLREITGLEVHEHCDRRYPPRCRFELA
jgi:predicted ArsR family transcriptional regulator